MDTKGIDGVVLEVFEELGQARQKFPQWPDDMIHGAGILVEEAGECMQACLQAKYENQPAEKARKEAVQAAAMAIRFILNFDACTRSIHRSTQILQSCRLCDLCGKKGETSKDGKPQMNADERSTIRETSDESRAPRDASGHDLDIWGDASPTNSTPIPEDGKTTESTEDTENETGIAVRLRRMCSGDGYRNGT